ncbi:serine hydrolase domain-containing protein [Phenylobacterium sp.]|uniref:serine hydrolase domain-containing protein n=1 Tax=Phenylobacterium sp. TaxID=1871053 RepID=UPI00301DE608
MTPRDVEAVLAQGVATGAAPGFSAAVVGQDGTVATFQAGGRGVADPAPMTADTVFWIASCTKAIVSAAALELVARGRLALDEPVGRLVPELAAPLVLEGFDPDGTPRLRPAARPITLAALLSHTSGLAYDFNSAEIVRWLEARGLNLMTAGCRSLPLLFEPGDDWRYGVGIDAAGLVIEAAAGRDLGEHLQETVFAPLGMADTAFDPGAAQVARRAGLHARLPDGGLAPLDPLGAMPPDMRGGGGLCSTAQDYARFLAAVLADDGGGVFSAETRARLRTPVRRGATLGDIRSVLPMMSRDFSPLPEGERGWTLGFLQNLAPLPGRRSAGSLAWAGLANCYYWADPERRMAGVLFAQLLPFADPQVLDVFDAFERAVYARG